MSTLALMTLAITVLVTAVLISNWLRPDMAALLVMVVLGITGLVSPNEALAGFSSSAVITILAISILAEGLQQTGITYQLGQRMKRLAGSSQTRLLGVVMLSGAVLSLFMNNLAAVAVLMPATMGLARQARIPPSRLLMPLAYGVIAGGMATLFTTPNIIASSALRDAGLQPFGVLDFLPVGIPLVLITVVYMLFVGKRLLPERDPAGQASNFHHSREELLRTYGMVRSLKDVVVLSGSAMAGLSIREGRWRSTVRLNVIGVARGGVFLSAPESDFVIREGDVVLAQGEPPAEALFNYGLRLLEEPPTLTLATDGESSLAEIVLAPHSNLVGKTLREINFREKFKLTVLAIWRAGQAIQMGFANLPLQIGDALLVQGSAANLHILLKERDFIGLEEDPQGVLRPKKARLAAVIALLTLAIAISGRLPITMVSLAGAAAMILTGCLSMDEAYQSIDWKAIFLIAGMWPLSTAIQTSGLSNSIVNGLLSMANPNARFVLAALMLFITLALTNIMAGQSAVPLILSPIGLAVAKATGADPRAMLMAIALGSSLAFPTPIGHPVNVIVMGPGGYTFKDFFRIGAPLTLLLFPAILLGLRVFWGL
ncbi:MAG: SLC13 family permease [Candidatus Villigracilaceae bacterium]